MNFRLFTENRFKDVFGFDDIAARKEEEQKQKPQDEDKPIRAFNVQWMMDVLARKKLGGRVKATEAFLDHVTWGEREGAVRVRLTPNIEVQLERRITDKEGATVWVLKRLFKPKLEEFAGKEEIVANEVFEEVEEVWQEAIPSAADEYKNLLHLSKRMTDRIRSHAPDLYDYQDTTQINKDYYILYFAIRNAGVGKLVSRSPSGGRFSPEVTVDVNFNREKGLLHIIVSTVSFGGEGSGWEVDLPWLDSWYAPSQKQDEIIDTVLTSIKYY